MTGTARLTVDVHVDGADWRARLADEVARGLRSSPRELSPVWFYDARGGALFDEITRLPEYYLTRAERSLLAAHAPDIAAVTRAETLAELGSGTSDKTRLLLDALTAAGTLSRYVPFDVDEATLREAGAALVDAYPPIAVEAVVGDFHQHLHHLPTGDPRLVAFLGSTIGNLRPHERRRLLFDLDCVMDAGDWLLVGVDLVKDVDTLVAAYDDGAGVTAAFNRNALCVLNAELDADFDPAAFDHVVVWDREHQWIEMRLRSRCAHEVHIGALDLTVGLEQGEELRTEISAKFTVEGVTAELWESGFVVRRTWVTEGDEFALLLAHPYC